MDHPRNRLAPLRNESTLRKETFQNGWPSDKDFLSINDLVNQGFYYLGQGNGDRVQCVYCAGILSNWEPGDIISDEHKRNFPQCPLVKAPMKFSSYRDLSMRKSSFTGWPPQMRQKPDELAEAGLFYLGQGDKTRCFWCGVVISEWEAGDVPIVEHAKIAQQFLGHPCQWIIASKGREFLDHIVQHGGQAGASLHQDARQSQESSAIAASLAPAAQMEALQMGFDQMSIDEAVKRLGSNKDINLETLVQAILEIQSSQASGTTTNNINVSSLSQENSELRNKTMCKICSRRQVSLVFMPCGHLVCCAECGQSVSACLICSLPVEKKIHVFI